MSVKRKIGVTSVFMVGIFTIGAGVARTYIYLVTSYDKNDNLDFIADFTLFILWSEIEVNVAMIVCCMPVFGPVLGRCRDIMYRRFGRPKDVEFGLLGHSISSSTNDGKVHLSSFSASTGSCAHHDQEAKLHGSHVGKSRASSYASQG
ncbi:uncharacterized protein N7479_002651 [Penicillium vulpinum]|nr:uncharacterized protein N7479_002651 [Penicillium vulpinum]KAJ5972733.1 hypothetical protein N7479_002651 [Penicillium vulpinum]